LDIVHTKRNKQLNFYLPHSYGGFGDATDLQHLNLYSEEIDLPCLKPRTGQH